MDWLSVREVALIVHLIGAVMGAGGASAAGMIFFRSIDDLKISREELNFIHGASLLIWVGFWILVVSGIYLAWSNWDVVSVSPKFWAKQTIIAVLFLNGLFLNWRLVPRFARHADIHLHSPEAAEFMKYRHEVFISGAISGTSWYSALILGALRDLPYGYFTIMGIYLLALMVAVGIGLFVGHGIFERRGQ